MATSYAQLKADVFRLVDNDGPEMVADIDRQIARASRRLQRDLDLSIWRRTVTTNTPGGSSILPHDPSWLLVSGLTIGRTGEPLLLRTLSMLRMMGSAKGRPRLYAHQDESSIYLWPQPVDNEPLHIDITELLPPLSATNTENWLTQWAEDALLSAVLSEAELFLTAPERRKEHEQDYAQHVSRLRVEHRGRAAASLLTPAPPG